VKKKSNKQIVRSADSMVYQCSENIICREENKEISLINVNNGQFFYKIDGQAVKVWKLIDGKRTLQSILNIATQRIPGKKGVVETETRKFIRDLLRENIIDQK
jgi:hypothetical protein